MAQSMENKPQFRQIPQARLILTQALRRSLEILQMPQIELASLIEEEIEKNPLLELQSDRHTATRSPSPLPEPPSKPSLYDHLENQIRENIPDSSEQQMAREALTHLDERGFFTGSDHPLLHLLQTFDPPGIFARNLQESYLLQLARLGLSDSSTFRIVADSFDDLLQARYSQIKKRHKLNGEEFANAIHKLSRLSRRPISDFSSANPAPIHADLRLIKVGHQWIVESIEDALPQFRLRTEYLSLPNLATAEKETMRHFSISAKWLIRSIQKRRKFLLSLASYLVRKQVHFLNQKGPLIPISAVELAAELNVHESTISRALSEKYLASPNGLMPFHALVPSTSNESGKELLQKLIAQEDKTKPFTDDQLALEMKKAGCEMARRTITKYRKLLKIGSASARKHLR